MLCSFIVHRNILYLIEYFEEQNNFYLVFNKMEGGKYVCVYVIHVQCCTVWASHQISI